MDHAAIPDSSDREECNQPPAPDEEMITELQRVRWLVTRYLRQPKVHVLDPYEQGPHRLMEDPHGWLWKVHLPESSKEKFKPPYITRQVSEVIGSDNLPIQQPIA